MIPLFSISRCTRILWLSLLFLSLTQAQEQETVLITTTLTSTPTSPTPASYTSLKEFKDTVLSISNDYRNEHDACTLTWNDTLADYSRNWAKQCKWKHSVSPPYIHLLPVPTANKENRKGHTAKISPSATPTLPPPSQSGAKNAKCTTSSSPQVSPRKPGISRN